MRKFFLTTMTMALMATAAVAQHQHTNNPAPMGDMPQPQYFFMREEGKLLHVMNGKEMPVSEAMTLTNGTLVRPDGTYRLKKGKEKKLVVGESMDMEGKVYSSINVMLKKNMQQNTPSKGRDMSSGGHQH